jgi:DNA-binding NarL/FixJ family response regulator
MDPGRGSVNLSGMGPDGKGQEASGEVLLVDRDDQVREGLRYLLSTAGLMITALDDPERGLALAREKHFAVAVLDMDTPEPWGALDLLPRVREVSPATSIVVLTVQESFELGARAFRLGAADVVGKSPDNLDYLTERVRKLSVDAKLLDERDRLLQEGLEVLEQFLKRLMDSSRRAQRAEETANGPSDSLEPKVCLFLVVDEDARTAVGLGELLRTDPRYRVATALTGGEALDLSGREPFQIALVKKDLPDLPGSMVIKSLRGQVPDGIVLLFEPPGHEPGRVSVIEGSQTIELIPALTRGDQIVEKLHQLREAYIQKCRERRYLETFRKEHFDFLKLYVGLKQRIVALLKTQR